MTLALNSDRSIVGKTFQTEEVLHICLQGNVPDAPGKSKRHKIQLPRTSSQKEEKQHPT